LWLSGKEIGVNRLGSVDTMQRYIYIHGSPDSAEMGKIGSHGCVRMRRDNTLYFETRFNEDGKLFCISSPRDVVFINDTPEDIARYVAARLEAT
jgi:hypothetical protein